MLWSLSSSAKLNEPTRVNSWGPLGTWTMYVSPIVRLSSSTELAFIANSELLRGSRPSAMNKLLMFSFVTQLVPKVGAWPRRGLPSSSITVMPNSAMPAAVACTPSTLSMIGARSGSTRGAASLSPKSCWERTERSVRPAMSSERSEKTARRLSEKMNTPTVNITPSTTERVVRKKRTFLSRTFLRVSRKSDLMDRTSASCRRGTGSRCC